MDYVNQKLEDAKREYVDTTDDYKKDIADVIGLRIPKVTARAHLDVSILPIAITESLQIFLLGFFLFIISFWPGFLTSTFYVYKFLWVKVIVEILQHIGTWVLIGLQAKVPAYLNENIFGKLGGLWKWGLGAAMVLSVGYNVMLIIWGSIVTDNLWRSGTSPMNAKVYQWFGIILPLMALVDIIAAILQFVAMLWYFRKVSVIRRTVRKMWPIQKTSDEARFLESTFGTHAAYHHLKSRYSKDQITSMARGGSNWNSGNVRPQVNTTQYNEFVDDTEV